MSMDMTPPEMGAPEPQEPVANPWEPWQQAGLDPTAFDPNEVRNAAQFFNALKNPDQREYALSYFASQLRDDERQRFFAGQQAEEQDPYYGDPGDDEYGYEGAGAVDPATVEQIVNQRLEAFQREQQQARQQEAIQQEFERELLRATADGYEDNERTWIASSALNMRQSDPYSTTAQLVDKAKAIYDKTVEKRLQAAAQRQAQANADQPLPPGAVPSANQPPRTPEEAYQQYVSRAQG